MPKILENEALALVENIDSLAPEQQAQAADILRRYRQQQIDLGEPEWPSYEQAEQESESRFRSLFDDLNNVDKQSPSFVQSLKFRTDPDAGRARVAGTAFLSRVYQKQPEEVSRMFPLLRDDYLNKRGQKTGLDDRAFYSFAQGEVKRMTAREKAALEGAKAALRGEDSGKALAAWQAANPDFGKEDSSFFSSGFNKAMEEDGDSLPVAANLLSLLESGSFKSKDGKAVSTPFTDEQAAQLGGMVEQLAGMKPRQRKSIYRAMNARIEAAGYDQKGFWAQMLSELDRGLYRASTTLGTQAGILGDVMTAQANASQRSVDFSMDGGGGFSTPVLSVEEQQQLQRQRDYREQVGNVQAELQDIVAGRLDPVKPTVSWLNDTLETGMIKGPGAVAPFMAASAALGPWGAGILFTADFAEQNRRDLVGMGMDADQARQIGAAAAPAQAAVESLSNLFQLGRFPAVSAALARFTKPVGGASLVGRYVQNSLLAGVTEFTEEQIQDNFIVPASQELLAALNSDMPDVDWSFYKERAIQATPELAATLLPMALVFGGVMTAADAKLSAQMTGNIDALTALNFSQAQATEIVSQKTTEERIAKAASLWRSRAGNKASLEEGAKNLSAKLRELSSDTLKHQQELERRGILPRMLHAQDDSWLLTYNDGSTASFATHGEASKARWNWAEDQLGRMHALTREALTSMERNMSAGRELAVEFKPDARTAQDVVNEGAGMDQVLRRVEQGKALGDVPVEESFDNASAFDQATQDAEGFLSSLQILGSSRNEFKDGILRTTIKLWEGSNVLTLVEEKLEGDAKAILQSSTGRAWMLGVLRNYEQESGDKLFRDVPDTGITNDDLAEAWSHLGQSYLVGRSSFGEPLQQNNMRRFSKLLMRAGLAGAINAESTFWQAVVNRAQKLGELKKAGKLGEDLAAELERQLGIDSQVVHEQGAMQEAQQVAQDVAQQVDTSGYSEANPGPNGETFSISPVKQWALSLPNADNTEPVPDSSGIKAIGQTTGTAFQEGQLTADHYGDDPYIYRDEFINPFDFRQAVEEAKLEGMTWGQVAKMPSTQQYVEWYNQGNLPPPVTLVWNEPAKRYQPTNRRRMVAAIEAGITKLPARKEIGRASLFAPRAIPADASKVVQMPDGARLVGPTTFSIAEYAGNHRPNNEGPRAFDLLEGGISPADVYQHPEWYSAMEPKVIRETMAQLRKVKGNPKAKLTIYRAGPKGEMNTGDWVSLSKEYARTHAESQDPESFKVWQAQVAADSVRWSLDDLAEFGYFGEQVAASDTGETFSIRAFHGTPHKVDKFRMDKIGTGEGAQAYGWGLYFAESVKVAGQYKENLAKWSVPNPETEAGYRALGLLSEQRKYGRVDQEAKTKAKASIGVEIRDGVIPNDPALVAEIEKQIDGATGGSGNLYTVELLPDESEFLDWDKPLSEQSEKVKAAIAPYTENFPGSVSVGQWYSEMTDLDPERPGTQARVFSQRLASLGIPGIRYADGQSRVSPLEIRARKAEVSARKADVESNPSEANQNALRYAEQALQDLIRKDQEGTRNYVIFDENLVRILEENGKPVAQETEQEPEPGELAPDSPIEDLPLEGDDIPWTEETFSIAPRVLPEVFPAFNEQIKNEIAAQTKTIAAIHIDRMKVGEFAGVPLQGGFFYPAIVDNLNKGVVWAFNADNIARGVANRAAANGGFIKLVLMQEGNVVGNKTFGTIWFKLLDEAIAAKRISKTAALTELNRVRSKFATHPDSNLRTDHVKTWKSVDEAREAIIGMPQKKRGATYFQKSKTVTKSQGVKIAYQSLLSQAMTGMGFPDAAAIVDSIEEPSFKGVPTGSVVGIIKIDPLPEAQKVMTATEAGVPEHLSYKYVLHGKPVARMSKFKVIDETFPETKNKLLSQQHTNFPLEAAFAETFSLRPGDFASRVEAMFSPFQRSPEARLVMARVAKDRALRLGNELIDKANVIRTIGSIDREARVRAALAEDKAVQDYLDSLTPAARQTLEWEPSDLKDDPLVSAMLDYGKLMSKTTALQRDKVDLKMGDFDGAPWLPPSFYSKGSGIMPDQMAQAMFDAGLLPDAYTDTLWAELGKRIEASRKDKTAHREAVQAFKDAKKAASQKATQEAQAWADNAKKQAGSGKAQRDRIKAWLRVLDGILAAAPPEVRARVGGFVKMAGIATDEAALRYLEDRVAKLDKELDKWLKKEGLKSLDKLFKKAAADYTAGKKAKGKIGPDEHYLLQRAEAASKMDASTLVGELAKLDALATDDNLTAEQQAMAELERGILELVGNIREADAGRIFSAFDALSGIYQRGVMEWKAKQIARREQREAVRSELKADTGKTGTGKERRETEERMATAFGKLKSGWLSVSSFSEVLRYAFGAKSAQATALIDAERESSNTYEDEQQGIAEELEGLFTAMAGTGKVLDGEKLRYDMAQRTIEAGDLKLSQFEAITALLIWRQEDGRRHMEGTFDENNKRTSSWGYNQAWVDEVEKQLTPEGRKVMAFLAAKYGSEHAELNALYRERHGVNLPQHDNYAPILVKPMQAKAGEMVDPVSGAAVSGSILTPGSLRTRSRNAIAEPDFRDALQTFIAHRKQMGYWKAYYDLAVEMQAILGNRELMNAVEAKAGKEAVSVIRKWLDVFAQGGVRDAAAGLAVTKWLGNMTNRAATVGLLGRVTTLLVQSTQLAAASVKMPVGAYLKRFGKLLAGQLDWSRAINSDFIQRRIKSAPPIVRQAMEGLGTATKPNQVKRLVRSLGNLLSGADGLFTGGTYAILLDYHREQGATLGLKGAELEEYAHTEAERATEEVAQPTRTGNRSLAELTATNPLAKVGWAYASEARQKVALFGWALESGDKTQASKVAFLVFGIGGVLSQVLKNLWKEARGDDDEKMWSGDRMLWAALSPVTAGIPGLSLIMGEGNAWSNVKWAPSALADIVTLQGDLRDFNTVLAAAGLMNDTAAGIAALSNAGLDFAKLVENLFGGSSSE